MLDKMEVTFYLTVALTVCAVLITGAVVTLFVFFKRLERKCERLIVRMATGFVHESSQERKRNKYVPSVKKEREPSYYESPPLRDDQDLSDWKGREMRTFQRKVEGTSENYGYSEMHEDADYIHCVANNEVIQAAARIHEEPVTRGAAEASSVDGKCGPSVASKRRTKIDDRKSSLLQTVLRDAGIQRDVRLGDVTPTSSRNRKSNSHPRGNNQSDDVYEVMEGNAADNEELYDNQEAIDANKRDEAAGGAIYGNQEVIGQSNNDVMSQSHVIRMDSSREYKANEPLYMNTRTHMNNNGEYSA